MAKCLLCIAPYRMPTTQQIALALFTIQPTTLSQCTRRLAKAYCKMSQRRWNQMWRRPISRRGALHLSNCYTCAMNVAFLPYEHVEAAEQVIYWRNELFTENDSR